MQKGEVIAKIKEVLEKSGLRYAYNEEKEVFEVEIPLDRMVGLNVFTKAFIGFDDGWIVGIAPIFLKTSELSSKLQEQLLETLLRANTKIAEVTFGLTREGYIAVNFEVQQDVFNEKILMSELYGLVFGTLYFIKEIYPHLPRMVESAKPFYIS